MNTQGQNYLDIYAVVKTQTAGLDTGYSIVNHWASAGSAAVSTYAPLFTFTETEESAPTYNEDETISFNLTQFMHNPAFTTFLHLVNPATSVSHVIKKELENGVIMVNAATNLILINFYGTQDYETGLIHTLSALGYVSRKSGSYKTKAGEATQPVFEFIGIRAQFLLTIPAALYCTGAASAGKILNSIGTGQLASPMPRWAGFIEDWCAPAV